jgi:tetratricopeptide (TPR) repeat protein
MTNPLETDKFLKMRLALDDAITYGDFKLAEEIAEEGLFLAHKEKNLGEIEYFKGQLALLNEDYLTAIDHFDKAAEYNPKDGAAYNDRALCMVELGVIENALTYFDRGIKAEPDYATVWHNKGWLLNKVGKYDEAIECFNKTLDLDPDRAVTYENLADAYLNKGDKKKAVEYYCKAIKSLKGQHRDIEEELEKRIKRLKS